MKKILSNIYAFLKSNIILVIIFGLLLFHTINNYKMQSDISELKTTINQIQNDISGTSGFNISFDFNKRTINERIDEVLEKIENVELKLGL